MIDFTAMIRGQRAARSDQIAEEENERRREEFNFQREQRMRSLQQQDWERAAASYSAPLLTNMQQAADAGQSDLDFLINQRRVVLDDDGFKSLAPEAQSLVLKRLGEAAQITAQQRLNAGDPAAVRRLYDAFGLGAQVPDTEIAFQSGDVRKIVPALDPSGALLEDLGDGTYRYKPTGQVMRGDELAAVAAQGGGAQALPMLSSTLFQRDQAMQANMRQQVLLINMQRAAAGQAPLTDAEIATMFPGMGAPTAAPAAAPGAAPTAAPGVAPTAAPGVAPTAAPGVAPTAAPGVAPTAAPAATGGISSFFAPPAAPAAPATPPGPPAAVALVEQAAELRAQLPGLQAVRAAAEAEKARIIARLDEIAPFDESMGGLALYDGMMPRRVPKTLAAAREMATLEAALALADSQVNDAAYGLRTNGTLKLDQLAEQLRTVTVTQGASAAWGPELLVSVAEQAATPQAAKQAVLESPAMVEAFLFGIEGRLAELAATKSQSAEAEAGKLINARVNLRAALAARTASRSVPRGQTGEGGGP